MEKRQHDGTNLQYDSATPWHSLPCRGKSPNQTALGIVQYGISDQVATSKQMQFTQSSNLDDDQVAVMPQLLWSTAVHYVNCHLLENAADA